MYPAIVKVKYWDEIAGRIERTTILVYGDSFTDAVKRVEDYYGEDLQSLKVTLYEQGGLFQVPNDMIPAIEEKL